MRVAVVGSGVSGLSATWLLNEHTDHEVHLYEADSRPGGHANTARFQQPGKEPVDIDTAFLVFNPSNYPNFCRFLEHYPSLREKIHATPMSFSVSRDAGAFEWAGNSLSSVFCQKYRLLDPQMWRTLYDFMRFNSCAPRDIIKHQDDISIGKYLDREGYSQAFRENYLLPMTAAIWSTPPDLCDFNFPARTLIEFMHNHHLLQITARPAWLTFLGGSRLYINQILAGLPPPQYHLGTAVRSVTSVCTHADDSASLDRRPRHEVQICTASGEHHTYDHVILACHSDTALALLRAGGGATGDEDRVLGAFDWFRNEAVLHSDERLMPKSRSAWSAWNYLTRSESTERSLDRKHDAVSCTFDMNMLQCIPVETHGRVFVTLNPPLEPANVVGRFIYHHPILDTKAVRAQSEIPSIQNKRGISFAGAWMGYGFHEDGFTSGVRAAASISGLGPDDSALFEILKPVHKPYGGVGMASLAFAFDVLEYTGLRALLAYSLGAVLFALRAFVMSMGVDLSTLERELSAHKTKTQ